MGSRDPPHSLRALAPERSQALNPFEMMVAIILIVTAGGVLSTLITTLGKIAGNREKPPELASGSPQVGSGEHESNPSAIDELSARLVRLEEERDFYKDLLDAPGTRPEIGPPNTKEDASDSGHS